MSFAAVASSDTFTFVITFYCVLIRWYEEPVDIPAFTPRGLIDASNPWCMPQTFYYFYPATTW
jgi:hypothetical protein